MLNGFWYFSCARVTYSEHFAALLGQYPDVDIMWNSLLESEWCTNWRYLAAWQRILAVRNNLSYWADLYEKTSASGIEIVCFSDLSYPLLLKEIYAAPLVLFVKGNVQLLTNESSLAVVGTRQASPYGQLIAQRIVEAVLPATVLVSGLAFGIDTVVHQTCLAEQGNSIAVIPAALTDSCWGGNSVLTSKLTLQEHVFLSETFPGEKLSKFHFAKRNRLIAGLSKWTIVVEAPKKSGALITARYAMDENREVLVVPHPLFSQTGEGCLELIAQGATIITSLDTLLNILNCSKSFCLNTGFNEYKFDTELEKLVWLKISQSLSLEQITQDLQVSSGELLNILGILQLRGYVASGVDGNYYLTK